MWPWTAPAGRLQREMRYPQESGPLSPAPFPPLLSEACSRLPPRPCSQTCHPRLLCQTAVPGGPLLPWFPRCWRCLKYRPAAPVLCLIFPVSDSYISLRLLSFQGCRQIPDMIGSKRGFRSHEISYFPSITGYAKQFL